VLTPTLGDDISWSDSQVDTDQAAIWDDTSGIETEPVSVGQMRIETDSAVTSLALFGVDPAGQVAAGLPAVPAGGVPLPPRPIAADRGVASGDTGSVNGRGRTISGTVPSGWYSPSPVGYVPLESFRAVAHQAEDTVGSALLVRGDGGDLES